MRNRLSLGEVWEEALAFFKTEVQLVLPIAFAGFGVPLVALQLAAPEPMTVDGDLVRGPWLLLLLPWALASLIATMAISALALRPRVSVGEALRLAAGRLPAALGLLAIGFGGMVALAVLVSVVAGVETAMAGRPGVLFTLALMAMFVAVIAAVVRVMPVWAALVDGPARPMVALRASMALTRRSYLRLLLLRVVSWLAQSVALLVLLMPVAVVFALLGRATGARAVCEGLSLVVAGGVVATIMALWTVYVARLYRRLAAVSNGI